MYDMAGMSNSETAKQEGQYIGEAIRITFNNNWKWDWATLVLAGYLSDKNKGYFCYEWIHGFNDAAKHESSGQYFTITIHAFIDTVGYLGQVHAYMEITSLETGKKIYVDDGFWNGSYVHLKPPIGGIYKTETEFVYNMDYDKCDVPPFYDHKGMKWGQPPMVDPGRFGEDPAASFFQP